MVAKIVAGVLLVAAVAWSFGVRDLGGGVPGQARGCQRVDVEAVAENGEAVVRATMCLLNAAREQEGLPALRADRRLRRAAERHARDMAERDYFAHESPEGVKPHQRIYAAGYPRTTVGENLAWGEEDRATPLRIFEGWMGSPGHRRNILRRAFREIGIGLAYGAPAEQAVPTRDAAVYVTTFGSGRGG